MKKTLLVPALAVMISGGAFLATTPVKANEPTAQSGPLIQKLAQKLGRPEAEIKAVFDEVHAERHQEMLTKLTEKLDQAVAAGELSVAQKNAILAKLAEVHQERAAHFAELKELTPAERKAFHDQRQQELTEWAQNNDIDLEKFLPRFGRGPHLNGQ